MRVVVVMCGMGSEHGVDEARIYTKKEQDRMVLGRRGIIQLKRNKNENQTGGIELEPEYEYVE